MAWYDIIGTVGVGLIIVAYAAVQGGRMKSEQLSYSITNLVGAGMILISLRYNFNLASVIIEVFWILISIWGIVLWLKRRSRNSEPPATS